MIKELFCIYMYFSLGLIDTVRQYRMGFIFMQMTPSYTCLLIP